MKIIVFGASGTIGKEIVKQALQKDHQVTAYVRNPQKFPFSENENLKIYKGDLVDTKGLNKAVQDQDAVFCALGDGSIGKIRAIGTRNIINAMKDTAVKRLICQTSIGAGDSYSMLNFKWKYIMFGLLLRRVLPDHNLQESYIQESGLDYTIIRPSAFTNGPVTNTYQIGNAQKLKNISLKINRADVADFMLQQLTAATYIGKSVCISN